MTGYRFDDGQDDPLIPDDLGPRGQALWDDVASSAPMTATTKVILAEAARTADRLEAMHRLLSGDDGEWARLRPEKHFGEETGDLVVHVDATVAEQRQQAGALRLLIVQLTAALPTSSSIEGGGDAVDELGAARAARKAAAAAAALP